MDFYPLTLHVAFWAGLHNFEQYNAIHHMPTFDKAYSYGHDRIEITIKIHLSLVATVGVEYNSSLSGSEDDTAEPAIKYLRAFRVGLPTMIIQSKLQNN